MLFKVAFYLRSTSFLINCLSLFNKTALSFYKPKCTAGPFWSGLLSAEMACCQDLRNFSKKPQVCFTCSARSSGGGRACALAGDPTCSGCPASSGRGSGRAPAAPGTDAARPSRDCGPGACGRRSASASLGTASHWEPWGAGTEGGA